MRHFIPNTEILYRFSLRYSFCLVADKKPLKITTVIHVFSFLIITAAKIGLSMIRNYTSKLDAYNLY